ncbi:MAG TPA: hypothetical protein P5081_12200 [Phycisphaerae bacterium]|nr:hypothetical protein [Phycisphaerae bacterium]
MRATRGAFRIRPTDLATYAAWGFGVPGLVLSYYAAVLYVPLGLKALRDGRAARRAGLVEEAS